MEKVSVILPCMNEAGTVSYVVRKAKAALEKAGIEYEIIVADNSTDSSAELALETGAKVVRHNRVGYGAALQVGFSASTGNIIVMADADNTYNLLELPRLLEHIKHNDIVIGSRLKGKIMKGAMPPLHRYIGNPFLSWVFKLFFPLKISDVHSGYRVIKRETWKQLEMRMAGMEFATEMFIKASKKKLRIKEVPITYWPRKGKSKLNSFNDGWKHLRYMLLYSPNWLFFLPGMTAFIIGMLGTIRFYFGPINFGPIIFDLHPMFATSSLAIIGFSIMLMGLFAKTYSVTHLNEKDKLIDWVDSHLSLERGITLGLIVFIIGIVMNLIIIADWVSSGFGALTKIRTAILGLTLIVIGIESLFGAFFLSVLGIKRP